MPHQRQKKHGMMVGGSGNAFLLAGLLSKDKDLKQAREDFKAFSATLIAYLEKENMKGTGYQQNFCPMAKARWLQKGKKISNPYLGKSMQECGEAKRSF